MAWPNLVASGQRILASDINAIITSFSGWADSVNSVLTVQLGAPVFSAGATFSGTVSFAVAPTFVDAAGTRTALGFPALSTIPTLSGSNTFTAATANLQTIAATVAGTAVFAGVHIQNDLTAFCSMRQYSSTALAALGGITLTNWSVLYSSGAAGLLIETANATPIVFGVNNIERFRFASDGTATWLAPTTFSSSASVTFNGAVSATAPINTSGGVIYMTRPAAFNNNGASWPLSIQNAAATDNLSLGQTGANYTTSGVLGWVGNSNAYLYFNSTQDFRIGAGVGSTPFVCVKGAGRVLVGTATDDGSTLLQVNGTAKTAGLNVTSAAAITLGSNWVAFTPVISTTSGPTVTVSTTADCSYFLIGKLCFVKFNITLNLGTSGGQWFNINLPFANGCPGGQSVGQVSMTFTGQAGYSGGYCYLGGSVFTVAQEQYAAMPAGAINIQGLFFYQTT